MKYKRKSFVSFLKIIASSLFALILSTIFINLYVILYSKKYIYKSIDEIPAKYTVIVPGAKVYQNSISHAARDRIEGAADCIKRKKAERILISGDHGRKDYDEVNQMRRFAQNIYKISGNLIFTDHAGFSTYETMYRARDIFCVDNAIVATQKFHASRAVFIARKLGIDAVAYETPELVKYSKKLHLKWNVREYFARVKNFFLVLLNAKPTFLGNKIPIDGNSKDSWDSPE